MAIKTDNQAGLDLDRLSADIRRQLELWNVPGLQLTVVKDNEIVFAGGFGHRHVAQQLPVTDRTLFAHGSTGKAFTAFLAGQLVDEGLLDWDTPVRDYVPEFRLFDDVASARVSLRDLLCHRSGLPNHDLAWYTHPSLTRAELFARLRHLEPVHDLRTTWAYSNYGYVAAGFILGRVAGTSFEEELHKRVFEPLGMRHTYTDTRLVETLDDHAQPYRHEGDTVTEIPLRNTNNICPAGGIYSCAADIARWLIMQGGRGEIDGKRLISEDAFREMTRNQIPLPVSLDDADIAIGGYGLGWAVGTYRGRPYHWHTGGIDGFTTEFMVLPEDKIAVGVSNNAMSQLSIALARLVTDRLLGAERDWATELHEQVMQARATAADEAVNDATTAAAPAHRLDDYVGCYRHPGYGNIDVSAEADELTFRVGEYTCTASHRHFETWDLGFQLGAGVMRVPATFVTDGSGTVSDLYAALEPASKDPIRFRRAHPAETSSS